MCFVRLLEFNYKIVNFEIFHLFIYFSLLFFLVFILILVSYSFAPALPDQEKLGSYECGFEPFSDARSNFDIHFYLIGILFLIFDLEIVFLYPWVFSHFTNADNSFFIINILYLFLLLLGIGFVIEWRKQALTWSPSF